MRDYGGQTVRSGGYPPAVFRLIRPINWRIKEKKKNAAMAAETLFFWKWGRPPKGSAACFEKAVTWKELFVICKGSLN